jgi:small subunit ribosomal protein S1
MNEINENHVTEGNKEGDNYTDMASLLAEEGLGLDLPKVGEIKIGRIASISPGQIMVGIGAKSEGIIRGQEFEMIPPDVLASFSVGQDIPVFIITPEDHHGNLLLSYVRAMEAETWENAQQLMDDKESFTGIVEGYNRGGLLVNFNGLNGFIPGSQLSFTRRSDVNGTTPEERFNEFVGEEIELRVIEVDQERRRLIFSERAAVHESRDSIRDKVIEKVDVGDVRTGRVTSLADFGAFVNINGADGLVHLSEISWDRIRHPSDVLQVGQEVEVEVISIDEVKRHIGLSIRRLQDDPWQDQIGDLKVGQLVNATITRLTKFGAFAQITDDIEGLIHISEISDEHIAHPKEVLHEDDQVTLRIIKIESDSHRIGLSLRRVESLAFADMDLKELEKELEDSDITITSDEAPAKSAETEEAEEPAEPEQILEQEQSEQTLTDEGEIVVESESEQEDTEDSKASAETEE